MPDGPHRGGIAGWLNEEGAPEFLYPEVAGYYLTWLAFLAAAYPDHLATTSHGKLALQWVSEQVAAGNFPPTRLYLQSMKEDWRNSVLFSFDLAMLSRGAALAPDPDGEAGWEDTLARILVRLGAFIDLDALIRPYLRAKIGSSAPLPQKWSLAPGPHQVKVAAAILALPRDTVPQDLAVAAARLYWRWRGGGPSTQLTGDTHPILYYLEGLLLAGAHGIDDEAWPLAALAYTTLMKAQLPEGGLPPRLNDSRAPLRSDVLAQALRAGCVLRDKGCLSPSRWNLRLEQLAMNLMPFVQDDGSVEFCRNANQGHRNTWSAIFTHQALCFFETLSCGQTIPDSWLKLLI